jgi:hypothetical protein
VIVLLYGVIMTLPRRAQLTLGALSMLLLLGMLGLAWWAWRHRPGHQPDPRFRRARIVLATVCLMIIAIGAAWRLDVALQPTAACSPPSGAPAGPSNGLSAALAGQQVATWPETGVGLLYGQANGARICLSRHEDYYVAVNAHHIAGSSAMTVGDIVLTPGFNMNKQERAALAAHEAHHRVQWAWGTVIGGPLAFPVAYAVVDFFFPGARNPFERAAGLERGLYTPSGTGPVLGPAQLAVLATLAAIMALAIAAAWYRRSARPQAQR